jgi:transport factor 2 (NTF2)-like protein
LTIPKYNDNQDNQIIVQKYFKKIKAGDVHGLLELFSNDSVIYEPFSSSKLLSGKSEIEPFLKSVIMANEGLEYELNIDKQKNKRKNHIVALVTFRKQNEIRSRFTFGLDNSHDSKYISGRIKSLLIEFTD